MYGYARGPLWGYVVLQQISVVKFHFWKQKTDIMTQCYSSVFREDSISPFPHQQRNAIKTQTYNLSNKALFQTHKEDNIAFQTNFYLHCCGRCGPAWVAVLRCCQNLRSAPAAADIHSRHTLDANSSTHSTL